MLSQKEFGKEKEEDGLHLEGGGHLLGMNDNKIAVRRRWGSAFGKAREKADFAKTGEHRDWPALLIF
ncbi:hypothetical protein L0128_00975 [candidate division KSB1 bacterium]|nr:hypothetical protein [candidate division KSB1 bacterium]